MRILIMVACAGTFAGCGYSVGGLIEHRSVHLPIFGSHSERRGFEFELHRAVSRELSAQGVRVNDPAATVELRGMIVDVTEPVAVEGGDDEVLVGSVAFKIEVTLIGRPGGREIWKRGLEEQAAFSTQRLQTRETARQAVIDRLARRVAGLLEKEL
jgi:hypothetical protein